MKIFSGIRPAFPWAIFLGAAILLFTVAARAEPPTVRIPRVSRPPRLEDFLNGTPRDAEAVVTDFRQREPDDGEPVTQPTTAYFSYDDKNLYVVFVCKDDPSKIRAHMSKREDIFSDDAVGVFFDSYRDHQRCYEFITNPLGIQLDGIASETQGDDFSFDTLWHSEGRLTADGYIVWIALPFKSLRFKGAQPQVWGVSVMRIIQRNNESSFWPHITRKITGFTPQFATLEGLENISPGRNIQLIPYGFLAQARFLDQQIPGFRSETEKRAGLDAKFVFHDSITLDVTLNPDFSQVESDEPQVTVNQRFEVFFPEKRPFFLENSGFFQTPENLFFSRRIGNPQAGVRVTGKAGRWVFGALAIDDRAPGKALPEGDPLHGDRAGIGVIRLQREFGESTAGILVTSRDFAGSSNRVLSIDTRLKLSPTWYFTGQAMTSLTRRLDGTRSAGPAYVADIFHQDRHFVYEVNYLDRSPSFDTQLGFVPRVDIRQVSHFASYRWRPKKSRLVAFGPNSFTSFNWNRQGRLQDWRQNIAFQAEFKGQTQVFVRRAEFFELFQNIGFREHSNTVQFNTSWLKWLEVGANMNNGLGVNFFPAGALAPFSASSLDGGFFLTLKPSSRLRFQQTYLYDRLGAARRFLPPDTKRTVAIFNNHILRSKLTYQFTRALSLRAILDYNAVLPNTSLVSLDKAKRLTGDLLVTYLVNPGTAIYLGYTDTHENLLLDAGLPPTLRRIASPVTSTGRQGFVKVSYLFRF